MAHIQFVYEHHNLNGFNNLRTGSTMMHGLRSAATHVIKSKIKSTRLYRPLFGARQWLREVRLRFNEWSQSTKWHINLKPSSVYVTSLQQSPESLEAWISLAGALGRENNLDCHMVELLKNHKILGPNSVAMRHEDELYRTLADDFIHGAAVLTQTNK